MSCIAVIALALAAADCGGGCVGTCVTESITSVSLTLPDSIAVGDTKPASGAAIGTNVSHAAVTWISDKPSVATIDPTTGMITAVAPGTATIKATSAAQPTVSRSATLKVYVAGSVKSIAIPPMSVFLGASVQLNATVTADLGIDKTLNWVSGNVAIATVSADGVVTGVAGGSTTITATSRATPAVSATVSVTVVPVVRSIALTAPTTTILVGASGTVAAALTGDADADKTLDWASMSPAIATVNGAGVVTGLAAGTATITATSRINAAVSASVSVPIVLPTVHAITLTAPTAAVFVGASGAVTATVNADAGVDQTLDWTSTTPAIATVSNAGVVTGVSAGTATIVAKSHLNPEVSATVTVPIAGVVRSVAVTTTGNGIIGLDATAQYVATVSADPGVSTAVTWSSSNSAVATVSSSGVVTGFAPGTVTITAKSTADNTKSGSASALIGSVRTVTVSQPISNINVRSTVLLSAAVNADVNVPTTVTWSTSDASIARVSTSGVVTGVGDGTATITATSTADPTKSGAATVTVFDPCFGRPLTLGTVINATLVPANACAGRADIYRFTTTAATTFFRAEMSSNVFPPSFAPLRDWGVGLLGPGTNTWYVATRPGTYSMRAGVDDPAVTGVYTLSTTLNPTIPSNVCPNVNATPGVTLTLPLNAGCGYSPLGLFGSFNTTAIYTVVPDGTGLVVQVRATGFSPLIEIKGMDDTILRSSSGQTGSEVSTPPFMAAGDLSVRVFVTSRIPSQTGTFTLSLIMAIP